MNSRPADSPEARVAAHYTREGLEAAILRAFAAGDNSRPLTAIDLAPLDEFHVGGLEATKDLAAQMNLRPGMRLLDVGCGIGGPARYFAAEQGCQVSGIDVTKEFIQIAARLKHILNLDARAEFAAASALDLPFGPAAFDGAYMIHVGMNMEDKAGVFRALRKVLRPGAVFAIFDVMRAGEGAMLYPVPWALNQETDYAAGVDAYLDALAGAGFHLEKQRSRAEFAIEFSRRAVERVAETRSAAGAPPALGLQLLMGEKAPAMIANVLTLMEKGVLDPVEMVARAA
jgi:ubiquinone/menaquinone biosynthesis C-methylase UbiE